MANQAKVMLLINKTIKEFSGKPRDGEMTPRLYAEIKEEICEIFQIFDLTVEGELGDSLDAKESEVFKYAILRKFAINSKKKILKSFFSSSFIERHELQIKDAQTIEKVWTTLENIIGVETDIEKAQKAQHELTKLSRRIHDNEKFSNYLERIRIIARRIDDNEHAQTYIINSKFYDSLSADNKHFLKVNGTQEQLRTAEKAAVLLDTKFQFEQKIDIAMVNQRDEQFELMLTMMAEMKKTQETQITELTNTRVQLTLLQEENDRLRNQNIDSFRVQTKSANPDWRNPSNSSNQHNSNANRNTQWKPKFEWQKTWELGINGFPIRCTSCGLLGHAERNCRGTKRVCDICHQVGHTKAATKWHPNSRNEASKNF